MQYILGIESSCDETGIAIYDIINHKIISQTLFSQIELHNEYGGVVPELASRDHLNQIIILIDECLIQANLPLTKIDAISYTEGPGLNGALLVGASVANSLAFSLQKPVIPVHHLEGHLLSPLLESPNLKPPFIALLVSGGHTQVIKVAAIGKYEILGDTLDDAAGEAFDKTAKMLGLGYPGGSKIAQLAQKGFERYSLPRPMLNSKDLMMSFSGLKTAVLTLIKNLTKENILIQDQVLYDIAKSIEEAITDTLVAKAIKALKQTNLKSLIVSGGVSANLNLRNKFNLKASKFGYQIYYPPLNLCTDNGAMIALVGAHHLEKQKNSYSFSVKPRFLLC